MAENTLSTSSEYLVMLPHEERSSHDNNESEDLQPLITMRSRYADMNESESYAQMDDESQSYVQVKVDSYVQVNEAESYVQVNESNLYAQPFQIREQTNELRIQGSHEPSYEEAREGNRGLRKDVRPVGDNKAYNAVTLNISAEASNRAYTEDIEITQFGNVAYNAMRNDAIDIELCEQIQQQRPVTESSAVWRESRTRQYRDLCKFWQGRFEVVIRLVILMVRHHALH